jgi:hypothetical protein
VALQWFRTLPPRKALQIVGSPLATKEQQSNSQAFGCCKPRHAVGNVVGLPGLGHTLQPTALVHEAWMRLGGSDAPTFQNRAHFFGAAAKAMRRILFEHARRRLAAKRGAGVVHGI